MSQAKPRSSLTNIEKKIKNKTFVTNSNFALFLTSNTNESQDSVRLSFLTGEGASEHLFTSKEFSENLVYNCASDTSFSIMSLIHSASENSVIELPASHVVLEGLNLNRPITLKGFPGTLLEIRNGSININLGHNHKSQRVVICETSVVFTSSGFPGSTALFNFQGQKDVLEVRDCQIKSQNNSFNPNQHCEIQDVCFWLNQEHSTLYLDSCRVSNFFKGLIAEPNSSIRVERSHFQDLKSSAFFIESPKSFLCSFSNFSRCGGTSIELKLVKSSKSEGKSNSCSNSSDSTFHQNSNQVTLENCNFKSSGAYGVYVHGDYKTYFPCEVKLDSCEFFNSKKEGLAIKHLNTTSVSIESNTFKQNLKSGCWLQKVNCPVKLIQNQTCESQKGYGVFLYDVSANISYLESYRNALGGIMAVGSKTSSSRQVTLTKSSLQNNCENALSILNFTQGSVKVSKTQINRNTGNGVYITDCEKACLHFKHCFLTNNSGYGAVISKARGLISNSVFEGNYLGTLCMDETAKRIFTIKNKDTHNSVDTKKSPCKPNCLIF